MRWSVIGLVALLVSGCGDGGRPVATEEAQRCLGDADFRVLGPTLWEPDDADAPDRTLLATSAGRRETAAYIGWYDEEARAEKSAPEQIEQAKQFKGSVDRHGPMTIIWLRGRDTDTGARLRSCALR